MIGKILEHFLWRSSFPDAITTFSSRKALCDCLCRAQSYIFPEYFKCEFFTRYFLTMKSAYFSCHLGHVCMKFCIAKFEFFFQVNNTYRHSVVFETLWEHIWDFVLMFSVDFGTYLTSYFSIFTVNFEQVCIC